VQQYNTHLHSVIVHVVYLAHILAKFEILAIEYQHVVLLVVRA
jgi:hypothetical protein